jgi:hypothetical protein
VEAIFDPVQNRTVSGVYRSSDDGNTWLPTNGSPSYISGTGGSHGPHLFAKNSAYVFILSQGQGIFRSSDDGANWQQMYVGQNAVGQQDYTAGATCIGTAGEKILIGTEIAPAAIYSSSDNGNTWAGQLSRSDGSSDSFFCFYYDNGKLFAGGFMGVYLSTDLGNSWSTQYSGTTDQHGQYIGFSMFRDIVSYNGNLIAAVGFNSIQISHDNGISWTGFNDGLIFDWNFSALAIKPPYIWAIGGAGFGNVYRRSLTEIVTEVENNTNLSPNRYLLSQNYPNPFNPTTTINFSIPKSGFVTIKVYDVLGREVKTLVSQELSAGNYKQQWNANRMPSGIYFYRLQSGSFTETKKLILLK